MDKIDAFERTLKDLKNNLYELLLNKCDIMKIDAVLNRNYDFFKDIEKLKTLCSETDIYNLKKQQFFDSIISRVVSKE